MKIAVLRGRNTQQSRRPLHARVSLLALVAILLMGLSACTSSSGIFAGGSWQLSTLTHQHIRTLAVDTNNPQAIYAGDAQGKIFASADGGLHWTERSAGLPLPSSINALSFDATGKKLYAASANGLFMSTDAAQHWSAVGKNQAQFPLDNYTALAFDLNAPHTIYLGTAHHAVLVSTNDGNAWTTISSGFPGGAAINGLTFDTDNHQLWAATTQGIYRFDTRATTWQALNRGLSSQIVIYTVQPASVSGGIQGLIFAGTSQGFFRSQDAGAHWMQSQESLSRITVQVIYVDFRKPTTLYIGTSIGGLRSDDSGQSWGGIAPGLPRNQPVYSLALGATDYAQLFAASNDVYLFPGTSGSGFNISKVFPLLLLGFFFYILYRLTRRNRTSRRALLKPERIIEQHSPEQENMIDRSEPIHPS